MRFSLFGSLLAHVYPEQGKDHVVPEPGLRRDLDAFDATAFRGEPPTGAEEVRKGLLLQLRDLARGEAQGDPIHATVGMSAGGKHQDWRLGVRRALLVPPRGRSLPRQPEPVETVTGQREEVG